MLLHLLIVVPAAGDIVLEGVPAIWCLSAR